MQVARTVRLARSPVGVRGQRVAVRPPKLGFTVGSLVCEAYPERCLVLHQLNHKALLCGAQERGEGGPQLRAVSLCVMEGPPHRCPWVAVAGSLPQCKVTCASQGGIGVCKERNLTRRHAYIRLRNGYAGNGVT